MNAVKPAKPGPSKPSLRRSASPAEKEERKVFLREVRKLLAAYPRHEEDLGWVIETPYGPVEVGDPETPSGPSTLYFIPIRFTGTQEQFMAFWNQNGRFEKCSPNGKWNILDPNPRKALWLLRYRLRFTRPHIPLPLRGICLCDGKDSAPRVLLSAAGAVPTKHKILSTPNAH